MPNQKHYKAFISCSSIDEKFGQWLHKSLENYKIPKALYKEYPHIPKKLYPIFRDKYELKSGDDLEIEIPKALKNSDALIIICSKNAVGSDWVDKEIRDFKKLYPQGKLLPIMLDGEQIVEDAFPEPLKYKFDENGNPTNEKIDILASNVNAEADGRELAKLKLISGVLGVPFGIFTDRDEEQKRRDRNSFIGIWGVVLIVMVGLTIYALKQKHKAESELFDNMIEQGLMYKDYLENPLKAKILFANAVVNSSNTLQERHAKILLNSTNKGIKLKNIFKYNILPIRAATGFYIYAPTGISYIDNEQNILNYSGNKIKVWNKITGKELYFLDLNSRCYINEIVFSKDDKKLFISQGTNDMSSYLSSINKMSCNKKNLLWDYNKTEILDERTWKELNISNFNIYKSFNEDKANQIKLFSKRQDKILFWIKKIINNTSSIDINNMWSPKIKLLNKYEEEILIQGFGYVKLINMKNNNLLWAFKKFGDIEGVYLNKNENKIFICYGYYRNNIIVLNKEDGKELLKLKHKYVSEVIFSKTSNKVLSSGNNKVKLWTQKNGEELLSLKHEGVIKAIFSKDEKLIFSWGGSEVKVWDISSGKILTILEHDGSIKGMILNEKENEIISWDFGGTIKVWENDNNERIVSKNEKNILSYGNNIIQLHEKENGKKLLSLKHEDVVKAIVSQSSNEILSWSDPDGKIKLWDKKNGKELLVLELHPYWLRGVIFSKNEKNILTWGVDGGREYFRLFDKKSGQELLTLSHESIKGATSSHDGKEILSWGNKKIRLWNIESKDELLNLIDKDIEGAIFSQDGKEILSWGNYKIKLRDRINGQILLTLTSTNHIKGAKFSKNNKEIISWGDDAVMKKYRLFDEQIPNELYRLKVEVDNGINLTSLGKIETLSKKEWQQKKQKYEQTLKDSK